ncbi:MAG: hypothetical protein QMD92_00020 [bacterium]|nr:hypothetical protein [bacterium]
MPYLDYGGGSLEDVLMRRLGSGGQMFTPTGESPPALRQFGEMWEPGKSIISLPPPAAALGAAAPGGAMKMFQNLSPYMLQMGTALMRGRDPMTGAPTETVGSQLGGIASKAFESQRLNEALRKMIASQLSGGGSFSEGQQVGLSGADVAGLTPEQISGLYGTGLQLRAAERKAPLEALAVISEAYSKIMSGEAKPAEMEAHLMTAEKARQALRDAPIKYENELFFKVEALKKADAEIDEIRQRTKASKAAVEEIPIERKKKKAETEKIEQETEAIKAKLDPQQTRLLKFAETIGWKAVDAGNVIELRDQATGALMTTLQVGPKPEVAAEGERRKLKYTEEVYSIVAPRLVPVLEEQYKAAGKGRQVELNQLLSMLRSYTTGKIDAGTLMSKLSSENQSLFEKLVNIRIKNPELSEPEFGGIVRSLLGTKSVTPTELVPPPKDRIETLKERMKIGATIRVPTDEEITAQLKGKPPQVYESQHFRVKWDGIKGIITRKPLPTTGVPSELYRGTP